MLELELAVKDLIVGTVDGTVIAEPFYGNLLAGIPRKIVKEGDTSPFHNVDTAAVAVYRNRLWLVVNEAFFKQLTRKERAAVIKHEAQHIAHRHMVRVKPEDIKDEADRMLYNMAMDAVINQYNDGLPNRVIEGLFGDEPFKPVSYTDIEGAEPHDTFENYYELLKKQAEQQQQGQGKGEGEGQGQFGIIDDHSFFGKAVDNSNMEIVDGLTKEAIRKAARKCSYGTLPQEVRQILDQLDGKSEINWKQLLRNWIKNSQRRYRDKNIFRESPFIEGVYPHYKNEPRPEYDIYVDVSGSITDEQARAFFNEVLAVQRSMKATVYIHQFDTEVHRTESLERKVPVIERVACGGTNFECILEHARKRGSKNIIIMTDGYAPSTDFGNIRVLWAYTKHHQDHGGRHIVIDV